MNFTKLSGAGNDFILIDGTRKKASWPRLARKLCPRGTAIGADGLLVVSKGRVPKVAYYNADGSKAFCGNGMRCAAWWLHHARWTGKSLSMKTNAGVLQAKILGPNRASVNMPNIRPLGKNRVDTGVPHIVVPVSARKLKTLDPVELGRPLRLKFNANVNFVSNEIRLRTYERGVEDETLACGTGVVAAAWLSGKKSPVTVRAKGGTLRVLFDSDGENVFLEGPVIKTYEGDTRL